MIYKSGKEIKEIYIGDTPVTAVYIGSKLVWRSYVYFETAGTAVQILQSDAELQKSQGITYNPEANVLQYTVYASPSMRHIEPMLAANQAVGNTEGQLTVSRSEVSEAAENAVTVHTVRGDTAKGADTMAEHIGSLTHESSVTPSPGGVMPFTASGSSISEVNITGGEGESPRDMYISESVQCISIAHGDGETVRPAHLLNAQAAVDKVLNNSVDFTKCAKEWTASEKVSADYADLEKYSERSSMLQTCAVSSETGAADVTETQGVCVPSEYVTAKVGAGKSTSDSGTIFGSCSACMTTEIYEDPIQKAFDITAVAKLDGLAIADIDAMSVCA